MPSGCNRYKADVNRPGQRGVIKLQSELSLSPVVPPGLAVLASGLTVEAASEGLLRVERHPHGLGGALQAHCYTDRDQTVVENNGNWQKVPSCLDFMPS